MADLILEVDYDITAAEAKQKTLEQKYQQQKKILNEIKSKHDEHKQALSENEKKVSDIIQKRNELKRQLTDEEAKLNSINLKTTEGVRKREEQIVKIDELKQKLSQLKTEQANIRLETDKQYQELQKISREEENQVIKTNEAGIKILENNEKTKKLNESTKKTGKAAKEVSKNTKNTHSSLEKAEKSAKRFGRRLLELAKSAFIFSVLTKAFNAVRDSAMGYVKSNAQMAKQIAQIKGNLAVMGQTLFQALAPVIQWVLTALNKITSLIAAIIARITGKNLNEMTALAKQNTEMANASEKTADSSAKTAKNTKKAAKEAEKATASFDTLQKIVTDTSDSSYDLDDDLGNIGVDSTATAEITPDFGGITPIAESELDKIMGIAALALLAIGLILLVCGQIGMGIACIIAGLALGAAVIGNWSNMNNQTKSMLNDIMIAAGLAMIAIGLLLLVCGRIALGIAALIIGIVLVVTAAVLDYKSTDTKVSSFLQLIMGFAGAAFLALGIILCCVGMIPLGIALIVAGAVGLVSLVVINWDAIVDRVKNMLDNIKSKFTAFWKSIPEGCKGMINIIIDLLNYAIAWLNAILIPWSLVITGVANVAGKKVSIADIRIPSIPYLASGAVIPGGKEFLSVLGDQPKGKTNIETPEDLLRKIVKEESGGSQNFKIEATGSMGALIRLLALEIKRENEESSVFA